MLEHQDAVKRILREAKTLPASKMPVEESRGRILGKEIRAPFPLPFFNNSAVDGFAVRFHSKPKLSAPVFPVMGEIAAGETKLPKIYPGTAIQIFTGAPVPPGADAVVMQEDVTLERESILLKELPEKNENIRFAGEDIRKGACLLRKGTFLGASQLGLLAASGVTEVSVIPKPFVTILATGNELKKPGEKILPGQIYDSNTLLLTTLTEECGGHPLSLTPGKDSPESLRAKIQEGLKGDVLLIAGGVSVGKYDFVKALLKECGVREIFWKVNIKPGKPLFFGRKGKTLIFGLPGNPVSVFVTFEQYVKPALLKLQGQKKPSFPEEAQMVSGFKNGGRRHFVRCYYVRDEQGAWVEPLSGQGSHMIQALAHANALLEVDPHASLQENQKVRVTLLERNASC